MLKNPTVLKYMIFILVGIILVLTVAVIYLVFKKNEYYVDETGEEVKPVPAIKKTPIQPIELDVTDDEVTKVAPVIQEKPSLKGLLILISVGNQSKSQSFLDFPCVIGREAASDFVLNDPAVSRKHCQILREEESFFLEDLSEHNGTFLNGTKIVPHSKIKLNVGDEVTVGHMSLKIQQEIRA